MIRAISLLVACFVSSAAMAQQGVFITRGGNVALVGAITNVAAATGMLNVNPGCQYNATPVTVTDTRYQGLQCDVNGFMKVTVTNTTKAIANNADGVSASSSLANSPVFGYNGVWNGSTWDRMPGTTAGVKVIAASGALASGAVVDLTNMSAATGAAPPSKAIYLGALGSGATNGFLAGMIQCDSKAIYDASTNGSTELVALTSGRTIYVCGYSILAGGTVNVKLIYGTGTACATGSNNMTPAYQLTAQVGIVDGSPFSRGLKTASANALCINTSAGIAAQAIVYYSVI